MIVSSSWGRLDHWEHELVQLSNRNAVAKQIAQSTTGIAQGMARSYGDICLNPNGFLWKTTGLNRYLSFDPQSGRLRCEAGVLLQDIQRLFIPRGWMLPVTPGTRLITVGGAIANDVHGKNHHVMGSFGDHVTAMQLQRTDGNVIECGPDLQRDWFEASVGGIGLTGVITSVEIQLRKVTGPWLHTEIIPYADIDEFFALADGSEAGWEHTVSWIDCISGGGGRGLFMRGNPADVISGPEPKTRRLTMPLTPPFSLVNTLSLRLFNSLYFNFKKSHAGQSLAHYEPFFYPLDNAQQWNRIYGPKGFYQYQSVVPREHGQDATKAMLREIARSGNGSFLAILKTFGNRKALGMMSFPRPGVTLALDFPNHGLATSKLFERLDAIVRETGGRIYLAKDARMPRDLFESGYPRLQEFLQYRDPGICSAMSRRLIGS